ncbi:hypothetical protein Taro_011061 [Colocasia esculenta]|uniref:Uncharacterized protein n=1 Tax=Colocasia esculenta TaxID=4460 RepID=A0A843U530_COLES|nr:hypothetical protein [Colocasia esculenta]
MGKLVKLTTNHEELTIHPDREEFKQSLPVTKNEPTRGPSRRLATSSSLHARRSAAPHEPPAFTTHRLTVTWMTVAKEKQHKMYPGSDLLSTGVLRPVPEQQLRISLTRVQSPYGHYNT